MRVMKSDSQTVTYPKEVLDYVAHWVARSIVGTGFLHNRFCHDMSDGGVGGGRTVVYFCSASF